MNVSLTSELEKWIQHKVESGLYGSSSEVVRGALRILHQFEEEITRKLSSLRSDIQLGLEQLYRKGLDITVLDGIGRARD
jgi:antitoxin ParD1/3/4